MFMHLAQSAKSHIPQTPQPLLNLSRRSFVGAGTGLALAVALSACSQTTSETAPKSAAPIPDNSTVETGPLVLIAIAAEPQCARC